MISGVASESLRHFYAAKVHPGHINDNQSTTIYIAAFILSRMTMMVLHRGPLVTAGERFACAASQRSCKQGFDIPVTSKHKHVKASYLGVNDILVLVIAETASAEAWYVSLRQARRARHLPRRLRLYRILLHTRMLDVP